MPVIVQHHLICHTDILLGLVRHRLSRIQVSIETGEIAAREMQAKTMSLLENVAGFSQLDFRFIRFVWRQKFRVLH
jgi:hypothetical protein